MIRIAIIMGKMHIGGKKSLVMEYYRHIDRNRYQFDFICDNDSNGIPDKEIEDMGGRVYRVAPYQHIISHMRDLDKIFRENNYQIMHAYDNLMNLFPLIIAKRNGIRVRISESISTGHAREARTLIKYALRPFANVAVTNPLANAEASAIFQFGRKMYLENKIPIFKSVIDVDKFAYNETLRREVRNKHGWGDEKIIFGFIGRLVPQKNPKFIIDIFLEIRRMEPNAMLVVIGHGPLLQRLLQRAEDCQLGDSFSYLGLTEDVVPFFNAFDGFIMPSLYEGLPVVGIEAQAIGLPTIMSDTITRETTATPLAHYISLSESPTVWAEKSLSLVKENIHRRRSYAQEVIDSGFDSKAETARLQQYYDEACMNNLM